MAQKKGSENLINLADRPLDERQAIARKGGIASGESRREKASLVNKIRLICTQTFTDESGAEKRFDTGIAEKLIQMALQGDIKAIAKVIEVLDGANDDDIAYGLEREAIELKKRQKQDETDDMLDFL